jgi:hypothetical protein
MKVMVMVRSTRETEAGAVPSEQLIREMAAFNEELAKAGVLVAREGLQPSSRGKRVQFTGGKRIVVDGPFAETKELIAGLWIWKVNSMEEALEWVNRCPNPHHADGEIEIRLMYSEEDPSPCDRAGEIRAREAPLRDQLQKQR